MKKSILRRRGGRWLFLLLLLASRSVGPVYAQSSSDDNFLATLGELRDATFDDKNTIVERLAQSGHPNVRVVLTAFLQDRLYFRNQDQKVFLVKPGEEDAPTLDLIDPVTLKDAGSASADDLTKIVTNNHLRRVLQTTLARFGLSSPDASVRLDAVRDIEKDLDESHVQLLRQRSAVETDPQVKKEIAIGLALADIDSSDAQARLSAISTLRQSIRQDVLNKLESLLGKNPDGSFVESDEHVRQAAASAVKSINRWRALYSGIQTLFFGCSLGSVLVLIAIGLAITFGVMGVINMAHGELMMLGAYTTYLVQVAMPNRTEISILVAIPAAFLVAALTGILIERTIIRFLYGRPLETLLATFGVSLILQQFVRSIFTALNRSVKTPEWMSGTLQLNEALSITYNRLYIVIFTILVFAILLVVLKHTRIGLEIRAVSQNRAMAKAMGIRSEWVDALTFGLGSGIAGVAGVALSQLTNVNPNLGQSYIIDSFMVVVFGGVGNLWGAMVGGMSMGVVNELLEPYAGAVLAKIFVLIALILFIQRRAARPLPANRSLVGKSVVMPQYTLWISARRDSGTAWFLGGLTLIAIVVPILNLLVPPTSRFHIATYGLTLVGKYLCYALLALSVDLIWGYCGILSLGQAAFFSLGGYAMGMYLMREIGPRGVYGDPVLPDFMVFLNWKSLPWFWHGFNHFSFALLMVALAPGLLAFAFGWFAFRSRVTGVYLSIITQALTYALMLAFFRNDMGFGGNNGFTDFKDILGFDLHSDRVRVVLLVITALALALSYLLCRTIVASRAGRVIRAIRDAESRTRFLGYRVESYKVWVFVVSAVIAGIAGALYVPQIGIINPSEFSPINSIEVVIWVAVGGRGTLYGAAAGALLVNYAKTYFTSAIPEAWYYALGALFILVTLFLPRGIIGLLSGGVKKQINSERLRVQTDAPERSQE